MYTLRGHRGKGGGTRAQSSGVNWGTSGFPPEADFLGCSSLRREFISGGEGFRVSDEAVVSDDLTGQHNPMASQGPLDGRVGVARSRYIEPRGSRTGNPFGDRVLLGARTAVAYKTRSWGVCGRHLNLGLSSTVAIDGPFEAVLGKTRRTGLWEPWWVTTRATRPDAPETTEESAFRTAHGVYEPRSSPCWH